MISTTLLIFSLVTILLATYLRKKFAWKNSPPGPKGLPLIGNLLQMEKQRSRSYSQWAYEYGPIYKLNLLGMRSVVISDHKLLKETLSQSAFSGRPPLRNFDAIGNGDVHGVLYTDGLHWEELRRFTLRQLREFGFGKSSLADSIVVNVNEFLEGLKKDCHKPIADIPERLVFATVNSLWEIVTGERLDCIKNRELMEATQTWKEVVQTRGEQGLLAFLPQIKDVFPELSGYNEVRKVTDEIVSIVTRHIPEHKATHDKDFSRDFTDAFLNEMKKAKDPKSAFHGVKGDRHLTTLIWDLYLAGSDTTSSTLAFMVLYLSKMPEVQRKFQEEIEEITNGNSRQVEITDRPKMPYTEALISEALRYSTIVSQGVPHRTIQDVQIEGYYIPKDTTIIANLYHIHSDPKVWGDPENFRPERFLNPEGTEFKKSDALVPFSVGKRQCPGESLARDTLFLLATNMFQKFWVEFDTDGPDNGFKGMETFVVSPLPYSLKLKERV